MLTTRHALAIAVSAALGATSLAHAGAEINLVGDPGKSLYEPGEAIAVSIYATMTAAPINPVVALRGIQFDYTVTDPRIGLPDEMDFVDPSGIYYEFPDLPVPANIWGLGTPIHNLMIVLEIGEDILLGTVFVTAQNEPGTTGTLNVANAGEPDPLLGGVLIFGFQIDENDPITAWRFNTGELTGGTLDIVTVPEPATICLLLAAAGVRPRRSRSGFAIIPRPNGR